MWEGIDKIHRFVRFAGTKEEEKKRKMLKNLEQKMLKNLEKNEKCLKNVEKNEKT